MRSLSLRQPEVAVELFQLWKLAVRDDHSAALTCENGDCESVFAKEIPYTYFPLDSISLYFVNRVILLPSEY